MGQRVTHLQPASTRGLQGGFRMGRVKVASLRHSDQGQPGAAGQGLGQQGAAAFSVVQAQGQPEAAALGQGCQRLQGCFWMSRLEVPPHSSVIRGSRVLQGRFWGSRLLQLFLWCTHRGSQSLLPRVRGVRDRATGRDRMVPLPARAAQPPPSFRGGAGRAQERGSK